MYEGLDVLASCISPSLEPCMSVVTGANPSADSILIACTRAEIRRHHLPSGIMLRDR